jgi:hypothetical protein
MRGPPAMGGWHVNARTNGGPAGLYDRVGPTGRAHCSSCAGAVGATMRTYLHCPLRCALRAPGAAHLTPSRRSTRVARGEWHTAQAPGALTGRGDRVALGIAHLGWAGGGWHVAHRAVLREYLRAHGGRARVRA